MHFRPCIDIHNGKVKQIVGGSLTDEHDYARENFVSEQDAAWYARLYQKDGLKGGHIIQLNGKDSPYYQTTKAQALAALRAYPGGLQVGGGITAENGEEYLDAGASHVIVTSYVFRDGQIFYENLERMRKAVGKERLVLDLSCRKKAGSYYIVTDRWQRFTDVQVTKQILTELASWCDEFLIHAVDVEGKADGVDERLAQILGGCGNKNVTYAGGIGNMDDLRRFQEITGGRVDFTIGSALDIFGGKLPYNMIKCYT